MKRWLQSFSFRKSFYERLNQQWICGRACRGEPCLIGPDRHGLCRATCECHPIKKGDRWFCTRPTTSGGPCECGPLPDGTCGRPIPKCQPMRSLRSWRGLAVLFLLALTVGVLLLYATAKSGWQFVSPGALSLHHTADQIQCAECHHAAEGEPIAWLHQNAKTDARHTDSTLCLKCHEVGTHSFSPHSLTAADLAARTQKAHQTTNVTSRPSALRLSSIVAGVPHASGREWACATCHTEHHGTDHQLAHLSNLQCQSCHAAQFTSLAHGHPQFRGYPFTRRTRLIFDHTEHFNEHFTGKKYKAYAPAGCTDCHTPDTQGQMMVVKSFDATCAPCHAERIRGQGRSGLKGIPFIKLFALDAPTLNRRGLSVGEWPAEAEGRIAPFLELLLSGDAALRADLEKFSKADLRDLSKADEETLKAARNLSWAIKTLLFDLGAKGQPELASRLGTALGRELSKTELEAATGLLSADAIQSATMKWFPRLAQEVARFRSSKSVGDAGPLTPSSPSEKSEDVKTIRPEEWVASGGWYRSDADHALFYRPSGHADKFLTAWLDLTAASAAATNPALPKLFKELTAVRTPGQCVKCHSVDDAPRLQVNWRAAQPNPLAHHFTHFAHAPHLTLINRKGCLTCHDLNDQAKYAAAFDDDNRDPAVFQSNFKWIDKNTCAACHQARLAGDNCLQCHNYHIGDFKSTRPSQAVLQKLPGQAKPEER